MCSRHDSRSAVLVCEVIQKPDCRDDSKWLTFGSSAPVSVQALLSVTGQRIPPADLTYPELIRKNVMNGCKHPRVSESHFENGIAIRKIVDVPGSALFDNRSVAIFLRFALECRSEPSKAIGVDEIGKHYIALAIEQFTLALRERALRDSVFDEFLLHC